MCNESVPMSGLAGKKDGNNFIKYFQMSSLRVLDNTEFYRSLANDDDGDDVMMCGRESNCESTSAACICSDSRHNSVFTFIIIEHSMENAEYR